MTPNEFYTSEKSKFESRLSEVIARLRMFHMIRLAVFIAIAILVYVFWGDWGAVGLSAGIGALVFAFLVFRTANLRERRTYLEALIKLNVKELEVLAGNWDFLEDGSEFKEDAHDFSQDLDLFGRSSFFQYLNRSTLNQGRTRLAKRLASNDCSEVSEKQEAIKELGQKAQWRQDFSAYGSIIETKLSEDKIISWFKEFTPFTPSYSRALVLSISTISLMAIVLYAFDVIPGVWLGIWFFVGGGIIGRVLKKVSKLASDTGRIQDTFERYHVLLDRIESEEFTSSKLIALQTKIHQEARKASDVFRDFSKLLAALDQRNNILISIPANGFFLRDLWISHRIEHWIALHGSMVEEWFEVIAEFDALNSFATYSFNHPNYVYPEILSDGKQVEAIGLGHPLLKKEGRIDNDFSMANQEFFIITGANMAGKSTFLRTVGLSIVMANNGLPICAQSFAYTPIKLISSMRTTDSLSDNESYFFSELKRLKHIIDTIENEEHFIILDEILKGTNSKDKAKGSQQFVEKLVRTKSTGIIATHDLSLCELEGQLSEVKNYYFDAEIVNDELYFDYKLKNGVCQNMNASFLLRKMGIV